MAPSSSPVCTDGRAIWFSPVQPEVNGQTNHNVELSVRILFWHPKQIHSHVLDDLWCLSCTAAKVPRLYHSYISSIIHTDMSHKCQKMNIWGAGWTEFEHLPPCCMLVGRLSSIHGTILPKMRKFSFCNPSLQKPKPYAKILFFYLNGNVSYFYLTKARQPDPCRERDICREVWYSFQLLGVGLPLRGYRADISLIKKITVTRKTLQYIYLSLFLYRQCLGGFAVKA